jgi:hypothetical protein
VWLP